MKNHGRNLILLKEELGKKLDFKMKISLVLAFFALFQLSANSVLSQDKMIANTIDSKL